MLQPGATARDDAAIDTVLGGVDNNWQGLPPQDFGPFARAGTSDRGISAESYSTRNAFRTHKLRY